MEAPINANGAPHNATCSRCGASLIHVYFYQGEPVGSDCFERLTGLSVDAIRKYIDADGTIDLEARERDFRVMQQACEAQATARAERLAEIATKNRWLIDELMPSAQFNAQGDSLNFSGSIVRSLRSGTVASELPTKAVSIVVKILSYGYRGKARAARYDELYDRIEKTR